MVFVHSEVQDPCYFLLLFAALYVHSQFHFPIGKSSPRILQLASLIGYSDANSNDQILDIFYFYFYFVCVCAGKEVYNEFRYPFIKKASSFPSVSSSSSSSHSNAFDYIVVGGGTAGCPLAATLSQNFSVLVLERGGVPFANPNVSFLQNFHIALADTSPKSPSQPFVSTDGVINSRARVLGGGSVINAGFYTRASTRYAQDLQFSLECKKLCQIISTHRGLLGNKLGERVSLKNYYILCKGDLCI